MSRSIESLEREIEELRQELDAAGEVIGHINRESQETVAKIRIAAIMDFAEMLRASITNEYVAECMSEIIDELETEMCEEWKV